MKKWQLICCKTKKPKFYFELFHFMKMASIYNNWKLITLALDRDPWTLYRCSYLEKLIYNCVKFIRKLIYIQFCIKVVGLNRPNSANKQPIIYTRPFYLTRNSTNDSAVKWSRDTGREPWPVYCSAIGDFSDHVI